MTNGWRNTPCGVQSRLEAILRRKGFAEEFIGKYTDIELLLVEAIYGRSRRKRVRQLQIPNRDGGPLRLLAEGVVEKQTDDNYSAVLVRV